MVYVAITSMPYCLCMYAYVVSIYKSFNWLQEFAKLSMSSLTVLYNGWKCNVIVKFQRSCTLTFSSICLLTA